VGWEIGLSPLVTRTKSLSSATYKNTFHPSYDLGLASDTVNFSSEEIWHYMHKELVLLLQQREIDFRDHFHPPMYLYLQYLLAFCDSFSSWKMSFWKQQTLFPEFTFISVQKFDILDGTSFRNLYGSWWRSIRGTYIAQFPATSSGIRRTWDCSNYKIDCSSCDFNNLDRFKDPVILWDCNF